MAGKAEASSRPMTTVSGPVQNRPACGNSRENGSTPRIENQITVLRPNRSPSGPPATVPAATAARKANRCSWAVCDRHREAVDQIEGEVAGQAGQVDVLREDQGQQDRDPARGVALGRAAWTRALAPAVRRRARPWWRYQVAHVPQDRAHQQGQQGEERQARLAQAHHHQGGGQRPQRRAQRCRRPGTATGPGQATARPPSAPPARTPDGRPRSPGPAGPRPTSSAARSCGRPTAPASPASENSVPPGSAIGVGRAIGVEPDQRLQDRGASAGRPG